MKRKKAEAARIEEQFRVLIQNLDSAVALVDRKGTFVIVNRSFLHMFDIAEGTDIMNVNNRDWSQYQVLDEDGRLLDVDEHPVRKAMLTGRPVRNKLVGLKCPGRQNLQWILISAEPIPDESGEVDQLICNYHDITNRRNAEETLRIREAQMRFALEMSHSGAWDLDLIDHKAYRTLEHDRIFGYTELLPSWTYEMFLQHVVPEDRDEVNKKFSTAIKTNSDWNFECRIRRIDNEIRWIWAAGRQYSDSSGKPRKMAGIVQDITERIDREKSLYESQERYKSLVANARTVIIELSTEGRITFMNESGLNLFGFNSEEIIGKLATETIVPHVETSGRVLDDMVKDLYKDPDQFSVNINENVTKNGEHLWMEWYNKALFDAKGNRTGHMAIGIDITRRKTAEDALRIATEKLNVALENGNIGIWEWDLNTNKVFWDERTEKMFGLKPGTFGGTYEAFEQLINEEDLSHIRKAIEDSLAKGTPFETILRLRTNNEQTRYFRSRALIIRDPGSDRIRLSGALIDITGLKEGTEYLSLKLNEELLRSNKELERFAYVASHDLQEPLRMVSSYTQLLQKRYAAQLDKDAHDFINFSVEGAKRMHDQINGLLDYSRINTRGRLFTRVKMNEVVARAKSALENNFREKNIELITNDLPDLVADELQMVQLFQNLLSNALKFSRNNKKIMVSSKDEGDRYVFSVKDKGIGIEEQYYEKIFEMFQRLMPKDKYEGTGMGLAICKRIVERHSGKIWVTSKLGKGSTFFFSLPKNKLFSR